MTSDLAIPVRAMAQPSEWSGLPQPQRGFAILSILSAMSLVVLDAGMANVALPSLARVLEVSPANAVLVVTAYQAVLVMALLPSAAVGERFGNRRVFVVGVGIFLLGSLLCAISPTLPFLVVARFVQGLGGAAVMALGVALLRFVVAPGQLGAAVGWNALTVALSSAAAPTLGAFVIAHLNWPWLFLVNLPIGALALVGGLYLPVVSHHRKRIDLVSVALNGAAFALLVVGAEMLPTLPQFSVLGLVTAAAVLVILICREVPKASPLIPIDLLSSPSFSLSVAASVCCFIGQSAAMVALPFHLHHTLAQTPLMVGLCLSPWPLCVAVMAPIAGRLSNHFPTAWLCAVGGVVLAMGLASAALWRPGGSALPYMLFAALCGVGFGLFQVPNNRNLFLSAPPHRSGAAGGMQGTARLSGQTAGAVLMTLLFTALPLSNAPRVGLGVAALFVLTSGFISFLRAPAADRRTEENG